MVKQNVMFALESSRRMRGEVTEAQAMRYIEKVNLARFAASGSTTIRTSSRAVCTSG
jgi:ABC-type nitrate/sulfonate/bicarbonate transport system ATPase subunit